jgi:ribonuclease P protein component
LGITISRKVAARAIDRNRFKREIRESFRKARETLSGVDLVVFALDRKPSAPSGSLSAQLDEIWQETAHANLHRR